jgi:hypothetical protein
MVKMKQEEFNNMRDEIDRLFIGLEVDFYHPESVNLLAPSSSPKVEVKRSGGQRETFAT